jgi:hypothetical protein
MTQQYKRLDLFNDDFSAAQFNCVDVSVNVNEELWLFQYIEKDVEWRDRGLF